MEPHFVVKTVAELCNKPSLIFNDDHWWSSKLPLCFRFSFATPNPTSGAATVCGASPSSESCCASIRDTPATATCPKAAAFSQVALNKPEVPRSSLGSSQTSSFQTLNFSGWISGKTWLNLVDGHWEWIGWINNSQIMAGQPNPPRK